jgi:hypothetical protein
MLKALPLEVIVYSVAPEFLAACAPKSMEPKEIVVEAAAQYPSPTDKGWSIRSATFQGGQPNPCPCGTHGDRVHWLLEPKGSR